MAQKVVEPLKARFTRDKQVFELMALDRTKIALYRVRLVTKLSYHVGHIELVPEGEPALSGVTTPAHESFVTDTILDNEVDAKQAYTKAVLLAKKASAAKPKRARKKTATVTA